MTSPTPTPDIRPTASSGSDFPAEIKEYGLSKAQQQWPLVAASLWMVPLFGLLPIYVLSKMREGLEYAYTHGQPALVASVIVLVMLCAIPLIRLVKRWRTPLPATEVYLRLESGFMLCKVEDHAELVRIDYNQIDSLIQKHFQSRSKDVSRVEITLRNGQMLKAYWGHLGIPEFLIGREIAARAPHLQQEPMTDGFMRYRRSVASTTPRSAITPA